MTAGSPPATLAADGPPGAVEPAGARLRCDAARNLERILAAAQELVAAQGSHFTVEAVAELAGVGIGTVYRRFPTKDALVEAVIRPVYEQCLAIAEAAAAHRPPEAGLERYLRDSADFHASHRLPMRRLWGAPGAQPLRERIKPVTVGMLRAAQAGGTVRGDVVYQDLLVVMWTVTGLIDATADVAPAVWRRHLELVLDGLRPGRPPLAIPVPAGGADWEAVVMAATSAPA
jgi:AcrR family transcriptional regulator